MELREIEKSIIKKYRKVIWRKFTKGINDYQLIQDNDKIAVCISGGKDSFLMAKCLQELQKHGKINFLLEFILMDPGYDEFNLENIKMNADKLNIPLKIFNTDIFSAVKNMNCKSPCYMCAKMRRGHLYSFAKSLGCNKIALGHHFDDVIETILLAMFYNGEICTMLPKLSSENFEDMHLIRPLYLVREEDIISWSKYNELNFIGCACSLKSENSKRLEIKKLIKYISKDNEFIAKNIFRSVENINLDQIMGYFSDEVKYNYIDSYEDK